ncbi:hypothetical protein CFC21_064481 [Triticum aestivum]|uniref:Uncharacterized protein n=3 Tax=Triticum TaxID=4564 RepID=A0A9R0TM13_TRITD|nr:hypothetical protein CFC21_064481 [Triticum aestivum]VAI13647.1 unnamed protein product [Triticum turgidum subsp. durum]
MTKRGPRICAPAADGGHDEAALEHPLPGGERLASTYMELTPVFRDGAASVQHHGRTDAGQNPGHDNAGTYQGFSTPSTEAPTQLLPVLDIAPTSSFRPCFELMGCRSADLAGIKSARAPAKIRHFGCSSSTNLYSCC